MFSTQLRYAAETKTAIPEFVNQSYKPKEIWFCHLIKKIIQTASCISIQLILKFTVKTKASLIIIWYFQSSNNINFQYGIYQITLTETF